MSEYKTLESFTCYYYTYHLLIKYWESLWNFKLYKVKTFINVYDIFYLKILILFEYNIPVINDLIKRLVYLKM